MFPTVDDIYEWLGTLGCSLWGDWYIESPDRRRLAAQWLCKQMTEVNDFVLEKYMPEWRDAVAASSPSVQWDVV